MNSQLGLPEIYFFGQIIGATAVTEGDGIFVEAYFETGKDWRFLSGDQVIQTQTSYVNDNDFFCFDHPFDLHFMTENYFGWPRIIAKIWKLDQTNTIDLLSYGTMNLPSEPGYHECSFDTWSLHGNVWQETLSYFLDSKPMMSNSESISHDLDLRNWLITKPGPKVHLGVEVLMKNFTKENKRRITKQQN